MLSDFSLFDNYHYENFSSALLAFALRQSPEFASRFVNLILSRCGSPTLSTSVVKKVDRKCKIDIPDPPSSRSPDLYIEAAIDNASFIIIVEAKITAGEQPNQLRDYRAWLDNQKQAQGILVTLTRDSLLGTAQPDVELRWRDLVSIVGEMSAKALPHSFEASFWSHFKIHLEAIMQTFDGFSSDFANVYQLMKEIDLLLISTFRLMGLEKWNSYWDANRAAYWIPSLRATIGFYWWEKWGDPTRQNILIAWKDGEKRGKAIASLADIVRDSKRAKENGQLDNYINELATKVNQALV